ncbi:RHS repeat-associated core domain-containing protein [Flavobacteriaceae bacterium 3-367]|uniref:RHS repeat domain-containing protein n=1 Tax=Eudoraea algarum TaxID=3417568 RepID=UPI0032707676
MKKQLKNFGLQILTTGLLIAFCGLSTYAQDAFDALPSTSNWSSLESFDVNGTVKSRSVSFFDELGKVQQVQTKDILTNKIWASQTLYDYQGRAALSTLGAPVGTTFGYRSSFIRDAGNSTYSVADFEANPDNPSTVGTASNTLGNYYSTSNDNNDHPGNSYMDITSYPFSRTIFSSLNPGTPLKTIGGNKVNGQWPQAYAFTMRAGQELAQTVAFGESKYAAADYRIHKTVSRDAHGNENVVFADSDGRPLASARSGGTTARSMSIDIYEQGFVDIHVPQGSSMGFTVTTNGNTITTYNLITESTVSPSTGLPNGFYRVAVNDPDNYDTANPVTVNYKENYYDYSLNEYDRSGRLIASYQPLGTTKATKPKTEYQYNTLGQLTYTKSPDEGEAWFKYRNDGQIRYSQNSVQKDAGRFSYTNYDSFGRPIESGVVQNSGFSSADPDSGMVSGTRSELHHTEYDETAQTYNLGSRQSSYPALDFSAGNVAYTANDQSETWYSYDIYGRVEWLVQEIQGLGTKTVDYEYDPITGLVTKVIYQQGVSNEQFIHRYTYNTADQLTKVETSINGSSYTTHAEYEYYETGALKRTEMAGGAQGVDYVYNLAGQLKSINHPSLSAADDPGGDSNDLFGMQLDYNQSDYARKSTDNITTPGYGTDQLNGNIKGIRWNSPLYAVSGKQSTYAFAYDRNNWLAQANFGRVANGDEPAQEDLTSTLVYANGSNTTLEAGNSITLLPGFHAQGGSTFATKIVGQLEELGAGDYDVTGISYDANGNIQNLKRNKDASGGNAMDDLTYTYKTTPQDGPNQLLRVDDAAGDVSGADDIGDQSGNNYVYNKIGQLITNTGESLTYFYNASGLVTEVKKNNVSLVKFFYNDRNHRVKKQSYNGSGTLTGTTYYVRDAAGSIMSVYNGSTLQEQLIYGTNRLGIHLRSGGVNVYQLTDHLGNVRAVFQKNGSSTSNQSYNDYYPFGMPMPNRNSIDANTYRYAFQGQEKDPETGKEAFELRLWDGRIGRWLTTDPAGQYASPYLGMGNNPLSRVDPDGGEDWYINDTTGELEWHNTSASIDGFTWVGTNSASHDYLSNIGKLFGGSGKINIADIAARSYYDITGGFNEGLTQRGKDFAAWIESPADRTLQGVANTINSTGQLYNDYVASDSFGDLEGFLGNRIYDNVSSMTLYDWSYAAGYNSPDIAFSLAGGSALSAVRLSIKAPRISYTAFKIHTIGYFGNYLKYYHPWVGSNRYLRIGLSTDKGRQVFRATYGKRKNHFFNIDLGPIPKIKN